jgi:hypothetical protein
MGERFLHFHLNRNRKATAWVVKPHATHGGSLASGGAAEPAHTRESLCRHRPSARLVNSSPACGSAVWPRLICETCAVKSSGLGTLLDATEAREPLAIECVGILRDRSMIFERQVAALSRGQVETLNDFSVNTKWAYRVN